MLYTPHIERAIQTAARLHDGQRRKGSDALPYVTHLFSVALLLSSVDAPEEVIIAGLLHDTVEDTAYTLKQVAHDFGEEVQSLVYFVTEQKNAEDERKLTWKERKEEYIERLKTAPEGALLIAAADKIHNLSTFNAEYRELGPDFLNNFAGGSAKEFMWFYGAVVATISTQLQNHILERNLADVYEETVSLLGKQ